LLLLLLLLRWIPRAQSETWARIGLPACFFSEWPE